MLDKETQNDMLNVIECWVHCLLCYNRVYPQQAFHIKNIYGFGVPTSKSPALSAYIRNLMNSVRANLAHINCVEIDFEYDEATARTFKLSVSPFLSDSVMNRLQKQLEIKRFLIALVQSIKKDSENLQSRPTNWNFNMQYRYENNDLQKMGLLDTWIPTQKTQGKTEKVNESLKLPNLNMIASVSFQ